MLIGNHEAVPLVLFVVISVHHEAEWSEYAWSCWAWLFGRWDRLLLGVWQNRFDRSLISVIFLLHTCNRPRSLWSLCGSSVEHRSAESESLSLLSPTLTFEPALTMKYLVVCKLVWHSTPTHLVHLAHFPYCACVIEYQSEGIAVRHIENSSRGAFCLRVRL